jgi:23S rRNA (guanine745-N1)-methyltransferase
MLPVRAAAAGVVLDVFAPRNGSEMRRVLGPGGALVVATPTGRHLEELVRTLGLVTVDEDKRRRVEEALGPWFGAVSSELVEFEVQLRRDEVRDLVAMGPSARHVVPDLDARPEPASVTVSVEVTAYAAHL